MPPRRTRISCFQETCLTPIGTSAPSDIASRAPGTRVIAVTIPSNKKKLPNFQHSLNTSTWGYTRDFAFSDPSRPIKGDILLVGAGFWMESVADNGTRKVTHGGRVQKESFLPGEFQSMFVLEITDDPHKPSGYHWDDEFSRKQILYNLRFPVTPLRRVNDVAVLDLPEPLQEPFRISGTQGGRPGLTELSAEDLQILAELFDAESWQELISERRPVDVNLPEGIYFSHEQGGRNIAPPRRGNGQGRQQDPAKRRATEKHAEDVAVAYYEALGWRVDRIGAPYDLDCVRDDEYLRVEVKGTTEQPGTVELTINEVECARSNDSHLFIVHGIDLIENGTEEYIDDQGAVATRISYRGEKGIPLVITDWVPDDADLAAERYKYHVPWHLAEDATPPVVDTP